MYDHERRSVRSQGEFLLEDLDYLDPFGAEMADQLKARLRKIKELRPKAKLLNVKEVASGTVIKSAYLFYSQLSADAAHPTIRALKRHLVQTVENGERVLGLDIHPVENGAEIADTVNIACHAVLGVCVAVNQNLGGTAANGLLNSLFAEYEAINGVRSTPGAMMSSLPQEDLPSQGRQTTFRFPDGGRTPRSRRFTVPVILTTQAEVETWLTSPTPDALALQRPLPNGALKIVARGGSNR